jgi:hypothetical protein
MRGRKRRSFSGGLGGLACIRHSLLVAIAIVAVNGLAMAMLDALLPALLRPDVERAGGPGQHAPYVDSRVFPAWHDGPHQVASLKPTMDFLPLPVAGRKAVLVGAAHLPAAVPGRLNQQRHHPSGCQLFWGAVAHAGRIQPVGFREVPLAAVVLREAPTPRLQRQPRGLQALKETPPGGIDRRRVCERRLGLGEHASQHIWSAGEEVPDVLRPFGEVAWLASQTQVAEPVGAPSGTGLDVLHLQGNVCGSAIRTRSLPFFEQIFPDLVARQCSLLVLASADLRLLHQLGVEADQFLTDGSYWRESPHSGNPGEDRADAAFQRRGQHSLTFAPIPESRLSIARFPLTPRSSQRPPPLQPLLDALAPMREFGGPHHFSGRVMDKRQARCLRPRIDLQAQRLKGRLLDRCLQDDGEGISSPHSGFARLEQQACLARMHRTLRLLVRIDDKDFAHAVSFRTSACAGNVRLDNVMERFGVARTGLTL